MSKAHLFICPVLGSNKQIKLSFVSFVVAVLFVGARRPSAAALVCLPGRAAEEKPEVLYTSPSGAFRVAQIEVIPGGDNEVGREVWIVSTRDESRRTKLYSSDTTFPTAFTVRPVSGGCSSNHTRVPACNAEMFIIERMTTRLKRCRHLKIGHGRIR